MWDSVLYICVNIHTYVFIRLFKMFISFFSNLSRASIGKALRYIFKSRRFRLMPTPLPFISKNACSDNLYSWIHACRTVLDWLSFCKQWSFLSAWPLFLAGVCLRDLSVDGALVWSACAHGDRPLNSGMRSLSSLLWLLWLVWANRCKLALNWECTNGRID